MTILTLTSAYGPRTGGVRTQIDALRREYRAAGHETVLVHPAATAGRRTDESGPVYELAGPELPVNREYRNLWALGPVERVIDDVRPDLVEIVDKWTLPRLGGRLRRRGVPVVGFSCERLDRVLPAYLPGWALGAPLRAYNRWFARQFDAVVCHSEFAAEELRAVGATPVVVPLGVDAERFGGAAPDAAWRAELLGAKGRHLLLYVGRLVPEKRVGLLAEVMAHLAPRGCRLAVVGAGPLAGELAAAPGTTLVGFVRDPARLARLYASADVFIHPSNIEAFGLGVLEALAAGCRVVTARGGAAAEVLPRGWPTAADAPSHWADVVWRALHADAERAARQARARAAAFRWSTTARRLLALYAALGARG